MIIEKGNETEIQANPYKLKLVPVPNCITIIHKLHNMTSNLINRFISDCPMPSHHGLPYKPFRSGEYSSFSKAIDFTSTHLDRLCDKHTR